MYVYINTHIVSNVSSKSLPRQVRPPGARSPPRHGGLRAARAPGGTLCDALRGHAEAKPGALLLVGRRRSEALGRKNMLFFWMILDGNLGQKADDVVVCGFGDGILGDLWE